MNTSMRPLAKSAGARMANRAGGGDGKLREWVLIQVVAAFVLLSALGTMIFFGYEMTYKMASSFMLPNYITYLTLVVTILMAAGALLGGGNIWLSIITRRSVEKEFENIQIAKDKAQEMLKQAENTIKETNENAEESKKLKEQIERIEEEAVSTRNKLKSIEYEYSPIFPAGLNLAAAIRGLKDKVKSEELKQFAESFALEIENNAIIGDHLSRLFLSPELEKVKAAAMALAARGDVQLAHAIQRRLDLEKQMSEPNNDLIEYLSKILGMLSMQPKDKEY